jgi:hypothetical protein
MYRVFQTRGELAMKTTLRAVLLGCALTGAPALTHAATIMLDPNTQEIVGDKQGMELRNFNRYEIDPPDGPARPSRETADL